MQKISRTDAYQRGERKFFTGEPCRRGHVAARYVSTGGCVECLRPFKLTRNAYDKNAVPFVAQGLWVRRDYSEDERASLAKYLQQCIDTFDRSARPTDPPLLYSAPPSSGITPTSAPVAGTLTSFEQLPSADRGPGRPARCSHGNEGEFCTLCEAERGERDNDA